MQADSNIVNVRIIFLLEDATKPDTAPLIKQKHKTKVKY